MVILANFTILRKPFSSAYCRLVPYFRTPKFLIAPKYELITESSYDAFRKTEELFVFATQFRLNRCETTCLYFETPEVQKLMQFLF